MLDFTLGRKIDVNYQTNKIILTISAIVAVIGYFITKEVTSALYLGVGTFLAWTLAREVDPKHEYSAFLCTALSLINLFYYEKINLLVLVWMILLLRMVSEISGKDVSPLDIFLVLALSLYLSIYNKSSVYLVPFIIAIAYRVKIKGKSKVALVALIVTTSIFLIQNSYFRYINRQDINFSEKINIFIMVVTFGYLVLVDFIKKEGTFDDEGKVVNERKIRSTQLLYGNIIILLFLFAGISLNNLIIYFSVIIGVILYAIIDRIQNKIGNVSS